MHITISNIPKILSDSLFDEYLDIKRRYQTEDWGPAQLMGGRFAEVILRIYQNILTGTYTAIGTDIPGYEKATIMNTVYGHATIDRHIRLKTVPLTRLLLNFRNDRDSAHLGGFDANCMDALFILHSATWVLCELIRVYGGYPMNEAQRIVEELSVKEYPVIIEIDGDLFITRNDLKAKEEVLVLLYKIKKADLLFLFSHTKDKNKYRFEDMINEMCLEKLTALKDGNYYLLPLGIRFVEDKGLLKFS
mgnify:CR=1 FL=1